MEKINKTPHAICGAKTRDGTPCQNWGMENGRCRMHGGKSTGPKTPEGRERIRQANWKHGRRSAQAREEHRETRRLLRLAKKVSKEIDEKILEGSITLDELEPMLDQKSDIQSKLFSIPGRFRYLSFSDNLALAKYYQSELEHLHELLERTRCRQDPNTQAGDSSATETTEESKTRKTLVIRFCKHRREFIIEEEDCSPRRAMGDLNRKPTQNSDDQ